VSLFTAYLAVDWSAANRPTTGRDSIWVALRRGNQVTAENLPTRQKAIARIEDLMASEAARGGRLLAGFDFAFGYPEGTARALTGKNKWQPLWRLLAELVREEAGNRSNRFEVAEELNRRFGAPLFWGKPHQSAGRYPSIPATRPPASCLRPHRLAERTAGSAKSVFQLAYAGAVGSQSLLGIAALESLRGRTGALVWPFETGFANGLAETSRHVLCEIYPSLLVGRRTGSQVKDEEQVRAVAGAMARFDEAGRLSELLGPPPGTSAAEREAMLREEGSIMGAGVLGVKEESPE
jgi:precorrin-8X/cobalt-precorrin-8 methylmutase